MSDRFRARRRYRRMTVRIVVEYAAQGQTGRAEATTLGAGGLFIATDDPLAIGTALSVCFVLPGRSRGHRIMSRVVWSQARGQDTGRSPGMGIAFKDPAAAGALAAELEATLA